jgi:hypothetical protein
LFCLIETIEAKIFGDALQGRQIQVGGRHTSVPPQRTLSASNSSSAILVTVPSPTGGSVCRRALKQDGGKPWDSQPHPPRYTASPEPPVTGAREVRYHRVNRVGLSDIQAVITFAYHRVRRILLRLGPTPARANGG